MPGGGATIASGSPRLVPSRRSRAWKWTAPRAWYSAALPCESPERGKDLAWPVAAADGELDQVAFDVLLGAAPQFPGGGVPHDVGGVVVAVRAQRLAEAGVCWAVAAVAGQGAAVGAGAGVAAGVAGFGFAVAVLLARAGVEADGAGVDGAEGRGGEGGEHDRVAGDRIGDALAACEPGADEVEGVAAVGLGAAGAAGGAAVAAGLVDGLVGQVVGADGAGYLAGRGVDVADVAAQQDGAGAGGGGPDVREPGVVGVAPDGRGGEGDVFEAGVGGGGGADGGGLGDEPAVAGAVERGGGGVEAAGGRLVVWTVRVPAPVPGACPGAGASIGMLVGVTGGSRSWRCRWRRDGRRGVAVEVVED